MPTYIDLTHLITMNMPVYPGTEPPSLEQANTIEKDGFAEKKLSMYSHTGTHMDAPAHMIPGGKTLDSFPVSQFCGKAFKLDVRSNPTEKVTVEQLEPYLNSIRQAEFLILHTGWSQYWGEDTYFSDFPTLTLDAAKWIAQLGLKGIGLDAISIDPVGNDYSNHLCVLRAGMVIIENLTNLGQVGDTFSFYCLPLKIDSSDGSPIRAMSVIP